MRSSHAMGVERIRSQTARDRSSRHLSYLYHLLCRSEREKARRKEKERSSRPSGARKFSPKFLNITIPSLFFLVLLSSSALSSKWNHIFNRARERVSSRAPPFTTHARKTLHHTTEHAKARRTQDEERVWHAHADSIYKNGVNNTDIYLFSGINYREFYDGAYVTQIRTLYQSGRQVSFSFVLFPFFASVSISSCKDFFLSSSTIGRFSRSLYIYFYFLGALDIAKICRI